MYTRFSSGANPSFFRGALVMLGGTVAPFCMWQGTTHHKDIHLWCSLFPTAFREDCWESLRVRHGATGLHAMTPR